jgi:hypothetical protein
MIRLGKIASVLALLAGFLVPVRVLADDFVQRPILVELFTSQGCSSCPPADALLGKLSQRPDVLALTLPITYWDMLGWKDTLATEANTKRQKSYAQVMGHGGVYTPQIVIDGLNDFVGSRENDVKAAIAARQGYLMAIQSREMRETIGDREKPLDIPVTMSATPGEVHVSIGPARDRTSHDATIWVMRLMSQATVKIGGGENDGRTITYRNVVRDLKAVGIWKGLPVSLDLPRGETDIPHDSIAVIVQQAGFGRVIGAAILSHSSYYAEQ